MLAKNVNDNAVHLVNCGALRFFASKLAPTEKQKSRKAEKQKSKSPGSREPGLFYACGPVGNIPSQQCNNIATKYLAGYLSTQRQRVYKVTPQISRKDD
ncbi:hypothetical protein [Pseudomonas sp. FH4]|uniref:hypothetical protein n=1 Tax=Pseudomonas brenneri TaxID=129817 RepID=UPI0009E896F9